MLRPLGGAGLLIPRFHHGEMPGQEGEVPDHLLLVGAEHVEIVDVKVLGVVTGDAKEGPPG
ncbi:MULTISPECIES: hypothetical protein [Streptomyces]|uniref:hypothetical protein n=1 Tax=Streptomyces TaxID=1883 RepID=UPI00131DF655|nr:MULTISPECIES: hypothetical protein [Streptomyces]